MIDYKKRWGIKDEPNGERFIRNRPITKPIITCWDEFREEDKILLHKIKTVIQEEIGDCNIGLFGSRIKGYWRDESDYDIIVNKSIDDETNKKLREYNYGVLINISFFDNDMYMSQIKVEIP
jgi:predicted nucleotidyltransferase